MHNNSVVVTKQKKGVFSTTKDLQTVFGPKGHETL
jgi:hypothetical protein